MDSVSREKPSGAPAAESKAEVIALRKREHALPTYGDAHIPPGEYDAALAGYETWARCHGWAPRVVLVFTIVGAEHFGVAIPGYYRVLRLEGKPRRNGGFLIGTRSDLYRDLGRMLGRRPPTDCIPLQEMRCVYRVVVRDTETDQKGRPLDAIKYSVVDWVVGRV
jgi:hypothetical protein